MILDLVVLIVLGFAAYRITRFFIIDTLFEETREKFHTFLANRQDQQGRFTVFWQKILDLASCTWCLGFWVSLILYSVYIWSNPLDFTRFDWIFIFAIAGVQGILHSLEPSE